MPAQDRKLFLGIALTLQMNTSIATKRVWVARLSFRTLRFRLFCAFLVVWTSCKLCTTGLVVNAVVEKAQTYLGGDERVVFSLQCLSTIEHHALRYPKHAASGPKCSDCLTLLAPAI